MYLKCVVFQFVIFVTVAGAFFACSSSGEQPAPGSYAQPVQPGQLPMQPQVPMQPVQPGQLPVQPQVPMQPVQPGQVPMQPVQPGQPVQPAQNPLGGLISSLGQAAGQQPVQVPQQVAVTHIPWQSLSKALPVSAAGWALDGQIKGESTNMMGISVSQASCKLKQGNKEAKVEIIDTSMNPMIAMPFNMARSVRIDSSEERMGPINFGVYPGTQKFRKGRNKAEVMVMVHNRVMVTITVRNAVSEADAVTLGQLVNYPYLAQLVGG